MIFQMQTITFLCILVIGGVTHIHLEPELQIGLARTWRGIEAREHWSLNNIYIGPDQLFLIRECINPDRYVCVTHKYM